MKSVFQRLAKVIVGLLLIVAVALVADFSPRWTGQADIVPPKQMKNFDEFSDWRRGEFEYFGIITHEESEFVVMTGDIGALLASGPAAYVFEKNGIFYDWTPDMGDVSTVRHGLPVSVLYDRSSPNQAELSTPFAPASLTP